MCECKLLCVCVCAFLCSIHFETQKSNVRMYQRIDVCISFDFPYQFHCHSIKNFGNIILVRLLLYYLLQIKHSYSIFCYATLLFCGWTELYVCSVFFRNKTKTGPLVSLIVRFFWCICFFVFSHFCFSFIFRHKITRHLVFFVS